MTAKEADLQQPLLSNGFTTKHVCTTKIENSNRGKVRSLRLVQRCFKQDSWSDELVSRVEAGWNTSTVALRVIGGDEKGHSAWGHNGAILFLGDINTGTCH
jgi:hypothetical protein